MVDQNRFIEITSLEIYSLPLQIILIKKKTLLLKKMFVYRQKFMLRPISHYIKCIAFQCYVSIS